jgi:type II secretory pathway component GspD/PulD (secretin)
MEVEMRRTWWLPAVLAVAVLLSVAVAPSFAMEEKQVTLDLRDSPVGDALRTVFRDTPFSFTLSPEVEKGRKVTLSLNGVPFTVALRAIGSAADLEITAEPDNPRVYVVKPRPTVSVGGAPVPVVGAVTLGIGTAGADDRVSTSRTWSFIDATDTASLLAQAARSRGLIVPPAGPGEKLVDLDVKGASVREAMAQLAKASGLEIVVHPAVSPQIKVTARAFAVPADWLLNTIVDQAHLTVVREVLPEQPAASPEAKAQQFLHQRYRYHIVPPPEIRVTGAPEAPAPPKASSGRR